MATKSETSNLKLHHDRFIRCTQELNRLVERMKSGIATEEDKFNFFRQRDLIDINLCMMSQEIRT